MSASEKNKSLCASLPPETVIVSRVLQYDRLQLDDGRIVQLAGIAIADPDAALETQRTLAHMTQGKAFLLYSLGTNDRWGRLFAHMETMQKTSIEGELIVQGLAHVAARTPLACIETFLQQEQTARSAHLGLWQNKEYERRTFPKSDLESLIGLHILITGTVHSTRIIGNRMYINFAHPWHQAVSLSVNVKEAAALGLPVAAPESLVGQQIRARGVLEWERNPVIRLRSNEPLQWAPALKDGTL